MSKKDDVDREARRHAIELLRARGQELLAFVEHLRLQNPASKTKSHERLVALSDSLTAVIDDDDLYLALSWAVEDLTAAAERPEIMRAPLVHGLLVQFRDAFALHVSHLGQSVVELLPGIAAEVNRERGRTPKTPDKLTRFIRDCVARSPNLTLAQLHDALYEEQHKRESWLRSSGGGIPSNEVVFLDGKREKRVKVSHLRHRLKYARSLLAKA